MQETADLVLEANRHEIHGDDASLDLLKFGPSGYDLISTLQTGWHVSKTKTEGEYQWRECKVKIQPGANAVTLRKITHVRLISNGDERIFKIERGVEPTGVVRHWCFYLQPTGE